MASPNFVGRDPELEKMTSFFFGEAIPTDLLRVFIVIGMGGCGKTQLVRKFMERVYRILRNVFYVDATTRSTLEAGLAAIAQANGFGDSSSAALAWMSGIAEPFFLYIDNADDNQLDLHKYFPATSYARIVITTRLRESEQNYGSDPSSVIHLGDLTEDQAVSLLVQSARLMREQANSESIVRLVKDNLHCLALAIAQAGAAIFRLQWTVEEYLESFCQLRTSLMDGVNDRVGPSALDSYHSNVYASWRLSYDKLPELTRKFLALCAHLHHTGITEKIFASAFEGSTYFQPPIIPWSAEETNALDFLQCLATDGAWSTHKFRLCVQDACAFSLLSYSNTSQTYSVHPLIHDCLHVIAPHPSQTAFLLAAAIRVRWGQQVLMATLMPHVQKLLSNWNDWNSSEPILHPTLSFYLARPLFCGGDYGQAELLQRAALLKFVERPDANPWHVRDAAENNLAGTLHKLGYHSEAQAMQRDRLMNLQDRLGRDHPATMSALGDLARTMLDAGQYLEAEQHLREFMDKARADARLDHASTLWTMVVFAMSLCHLRKFEEADEIASEALEICHRIFGEEHLTSMYALRGRGFVLSRSGRYHEAELIQRKTYDTYNRICGPNYPGSRDVERDLAWTLAQMDPTTAPIPAGQTPITRLFGESEAHPIHELPELNAIDRVRRVDAPSADVGGFACHDEAQTNSRAPDSLILRDTRSNISTDPENFVPVEVVLEPLSHAESSVIARSYHGDAVVPSRSASSTLSADFGDVARGDAGLRVGRSAQPSVSKRGFFNRVLRRPFRSKS